MNWKKLICIIKGHKPAELVEVALFQTPDDEPSITQYERWTGRESDILGTAVSDSFTQCERCKQILK